MSKDKQETNGQTAGQVNPEEFAKQREEEYQKAMTELKEKMKPLAEGKLTPESGEVLQAMAVEVPESMGQIANQVSYNHQLAHNANQLSAALMDYVSELAKALKMEPFEKWHQKVQKQFEAGVEKPDMKVERDSGIIIP